MKAELLHVVVPYFNPIRWASRKRLHSEFEEHMLDSGVQLTTIESTLGDRCHVLPDHGHINRIKVKSDTVLWIKENLINIAVSRLPHDWKYVAWIDGDVMFRNPNWASETVHALQHYNVVQPWEHAYDLGPGGSHMNVHNSWCRQYHNDQPCGDKRDHKYHEYAHPGYGWACKRNIFNALGGLIDIAILGAADYHMAMGLIGQLRPTNPGAGIAESYARTLMAWQDRANTHVKGNIGFVSGTIEHPFHGRKSDRHYDDRWLILRKHKYDPDIDIKKNSYGVLELTGNKPRLRHDLDKYFRARSEDVNSNNA